MSFKWDIEKVKKFVEENSECKLLSTEYKNHTSELKFECKCGNEFKTSFKEFKEHFKPTRFRGAKDKFKETIRNDRIKRNYCKENNINLLEIPYTQFENIEKILNNILK